MWMRTLVLMGLCGGLCGCQTGPEPIKLLPRPADGQPLPLAEQLQRCRVQAMAATEAFYLDQWQNVEDQARALESAARTLPQAPDATAEQKTRLAEPAQQLATFAQQLASAAKAADVGKVNAALQQLHLHIRNLQAQKHDPAK
jgi:hypothetical protein